MPSFRAIQVHTLSSGFRVATKIIEVAELPTASADHVVVQNHYLGINATDINITSGAYGNVAPPFGCGLEAAGIVTEVGEGVSNVSVGDAVVYQKFGAFAEYAEVPAATLIKTPQLTSAVLPLTVCGISASIALEQVGQMKQGGETVFVTAAAGGTGQFVVQLAKLAGNHVIGTCSSDEKVEYLKSLGCDRVINYTKENVASVLSSEYPKGLNFIFEAVGGDMFKAAGGNANQLLFREVYPTLLMKSASLRGFILLNHMGLVPAHVEKLVALIQEGKLNAGVDPTVFKGLEAISGAIDYMYAKKNIGKLVVKIS